MGHELAEQLAAAAARRDVTTFAPRCSTRVRPRARRPSWRCSRTRPWWSSTSWPSSSSSSSGAAPPASSSPGPPARRGRGAAREPRAGRLRHVGLLSVEPPAGPRPARAAAPRAAPRSQPLRHHRPTSRTGWRGSASPSRACRSGARSCPRWRTRASAASCGSPTSTSLDLSNLNRVVGGLADVGVSKVVLAAREVAELDPYIHVVAFRRGVEEATIADFVAGADVRRRRVRRPRDEGRACASTRRAARRPVVMATSHRGMLDVERFDLEPDRPAVPWAARRRHLGRAGRPHDQAEGPVRDRASSTRRASRIARRPRWSRSRRRSRPGRSSPPTSRSAARWWPTPSGGSRSASSPRRDASTPTSTS